MAVIKFYFVSPEGNRVRLIKYPAESLSFPILDWRLIVYYYVYTYARVCVYNIILYTRIISILLFASLYLLTYTTLPSPSLMPIKLTQRH